MTFTPTTTTTNPSELADRWRTWSDEGLPSDLERRLRAINTYSTEAITRVLELSAELEKGLEVSSLLRAVDRFLSSSGEWSERLDRRATLLVLDRLTAPSTEPPVLPVWSAPQANLRRRIFTDVEIGLVRSCSFVTAKCASTVGALDAGTASGELHKIVPSAVVRSATGQPTHLDGFGTERTSPFGYPVATPRRLEIPRWAQLHFVQLLERTPHDALLLYTGKATDPAKIQSAILMSAGKALAKAGLAHDPTVQPLSIRNTAARRVYEAHGIEAAATFLGHDDFMSVAREIGIREHMPSRQR